MLQDQRHPKLNIQCLNEDYAIKRPSFFFEILNIYTHKIKTEIGVYLLLSTLQCIEQTEFDLFGLKICNLKMN